MPKQSGSLGRGVSWRCVNGWYHIRFRDRSKSPQEKSFALDTDDVSIAMERARNYLRRFEFGDFDPWEDASSKDVPWKTALERFKRDRKGVILDKTIEDYADVVEDFFEFTPRATSPRLVTPEHVRAFVYRSHLSQASRGSYYRKLRVFFKWCKEKGYVEEVPLLPKEDKPKDYEPVPKALKGGELGRLLAAIDAWHDPEHGNKFYKRRDPNEFWARKAFELLAWTGLRPSEGRRLKWKDVHWPHDGRPGYIVVESRTKKKEKGRTKGGSDGVKTMLPQAEQILRTLSAERLTEDPNEYVLKGADGKTQIPVKKLSARFNHYRDEAKLPDTYTLYSLRHTFAAEYLRRGGSIALLQDEMMHKDPKTTRKYSVLDPRERMEITRRLFEDIPQNKPAEDIPQNKPAEAGNNGHVGKNGGRINLALRHARRRSM